MVITKGGKDNVQSVERVFSYNNEIDTKLSSDSKNATAAASLMATLIFSFISVKKQRPKETYLLNSTADYEC